MNATFVTTGSLNTPRWDHTATLLPNGKVLFAGGWNTGSNTLASAELYDPATGTWTLTGAMITSRDWQFTMTVLPNGKVLAAGGYNGTEHRSLSSTELYDPASGTWTAIGPMANSRYEHTATLLPNQKVLVAGGYDTTGGGTLSGTELYDPVSGTWTVTGPMANSRHDHTATLLPNGKVLVAGGGGSNGGPLSSAELYDPSTGLWTVTGPLTTARNGHTATLLPNGKVLVVGGWGSGYLSTAELYDPSTGIWTATGPLTTARGIHTATLLPNGDVLVAGGRGASGYPSSAELYDPVSGTWTATSSLNLGRYEHTATLLANGEVLIAGGLGDNLLLTSTSAELYDSGRGAWTASSPLTTARNDASTATFLPNGEVLVAGGWNSGSGYLSSAEVFNPASETWTLTGPMVNARYGHTATLLPNGKALAAGGDNSSGYLSSAELYDSAAGTWTLTASMTTPREYHTATILPNGKVLAAGGVNSGYLSSAELYDSAAGTWTLTGSMTTPRESHTATLLPNGKVLVAGGSNGGALSSAELYDPALGTWTAIGSMTAPRWGHVATLLPNGKVLVAGGYNGVYLSSAELYDPATGTWTATRSLSNSRWGPTATLLPNGKVLIAGGGNASGSLSSAELYDVGLGFSASWQPQIYLPSRLGVGDTLEITGRGFRGISEGSCGNTSASPSDHPVVQLRSVENGQTLCLPSSPATSWSDMSFVSVPVNVLPPGYALVTMFVNGIPSASGILLVSAVPVGEAVDAPSLPWTTWKWFGEFSKTYDGVDAAQSGDIDDGQYASMQTTVTGPGTVSFWWQVSSELGWDYLKFYVDDILQEGISGEVSWAQRSVSIASAGSHVLTWVYQKDRSVSAGADAGWVDQLIWRPNNLSVGEAVDALFLSWTIGGDANWFGEASMTHDGWDAAQSGDISDAQASWMRTTVMGPGTVSFWWQVSSEPGFDFLEFYVDGVLQEGISGEVSWKRKDFVITSQGAHLLEWTYGKDLSVSRGSDAGWVDQVVWTPQPVVVTIAATDPTAGEPGTGQGSGTFTFTRSGFTAAALTVNFTVGGTTTAGSDYTSIGNSVSFVAGSATATKTVSVLDDNLVEGDETVGVTLASGTGYTVGSPSSATVTIKDDDSSVSEVIVDNGDTMGVEIVGTWTRSTSTPGYWRTNYLHDGNAGKGTKSVMFRPTLPSSGDYEVSVWYVTDVNRATNVPMDIVYSGGTRTVLVNERVKGAQWVVLGTNTFAAGTSGYVKIRTDNTSSGYVIADAVRFKLAEIPSTPVVTVAATDATAGEPGTTDGSGTFTFTRTAPLTSALTVNFSVGGTATAGGDYTSLGNSVMFAAGSATATKTVSVLDDSLVEGDETVGVTLAVGIGYTVGSPSLATVTIKDDDSVSEVIVDNGDATGVEIVGTWTGSTSTPGYWRTNYLHDGNTGKGTKSATFRPTLPSAGNYEVSVWYVTDANRATNVPMDIVYSGGTRTVLVNERVNGGQWVVLGTNSFAAGTSGYVKIRTDNTVSGYVIADAMRFRPVGVTEVIVDNGDATGVEIAGMWTGSTSTPGYWRTNYLHDGNAGKGTKSVTFRPTLPSAGNYEVAVWYVTDANRATNVPMDIVYSGGTRTVLVNERLNGSQWLVLGTNSFAAGTSGYVKIRTDNTASGYVIADAVRFKHL